MHAHAYVVTVIVKSTRKINEQKILTEKWSQKNNKPSLKYQVIKLRYYAIFGWSLEWQLVQSIPL